MEETGASDVKKMLKILTINSEVNPNPEVETHDYKQGKLASYVETHNYNLGNLASFSPVNRRNIQNYLFFNRCKPK